MGQTVTMGFCSSVCSSTATSTPCPWSHTMSLILTLHPLGTASCTDFPPGMDAARCHRADCSQNTIISAAWPCRADCTYKWLWEQENLLVPQSSPAHWRFWCTQAVCKALAQCTPLLCLSPSSVPLHTGGNAARPLRRAALWMQSGFWGWKLKSWSTTSPPVCHLRTYSGRNAGRMNPVRTVPAG